ncbi:peptidase U32 family protein [Paenibacillus apiarius]|uniref:U32 family peptidase n=1 Tax=Paenibacillus apiarius TaxID=46240 RepID=A0ABT4DXS0_9BACL|nr:peptidase U32 family protein [Paenibacillus apiarius]MCY9512901.1 U32 family peptidase [Paenibacillus apiarius]MCY9522050.1 U32 family peptidase [Paenibacillus apiarius]MCY9554131.1 U32 family peptidase [Paenibacillus apiarius]MCY9558810.1 U32 family peptidase [Paenibacillus apiarius]MCY9683857.1 U32 family peptidase [Paenibacillus apiarius]
MTYEPELLVTAGSVAEVELMLQAGANAVFVGEQQYGMRLPGEMTLERIEESMRTVRDHQAKLYVAVNNIFHNERLDGLSTYLQRLEQIGVDAIAFGDPAVLMTARTAAPHLKLHWNAEMTSTNYITAQYWQKRGSSRFVVARELNMDQVVEMKHKLPDMEVQIQVHGMTNIYHSKRHLLQHYLRHIDKEEQVNEVGMERKLFLIERERQDEKFPLYEDSNGTHIMSSDDVCILEDLKQLLDARIDSFKVEGLLKSAAYNETVVRVYREAIDAYIADPDSYRFKEEWMERIRAVQDPERELSFGFFYKEQMY